MTRVRYKNIWRMKKKHTKAYRFLGKQSTGQSIRKLISREKSEKAEFLLGVRCREGGGRREDRRK